jgi:integrase
MGGELVWSALSPARRRFFEAVHHEVRTSGDEEAVMGFLRSRERSAGLAVAVGRYLEGKEGKAGRTAHLAQVRRDLESMLERLGAETRAADVGVDELEEWIEARAVRAAGARRHGVRSAAVGFFRWCRREGLVGGEITAAERVAPRAVPRGQLRVWTPEEWLRGAAVAPVDMRAWMVLGAFAGLRPEEIAPKPGTGKPGLRCEDLDFEFGVVRVGEETAKVRRPRVVPMSDALRAWLEWAGIRPGMRGPVSLVNPAEARWTVQVGRDVFGDGGWPADALRHSYATYRNAMLRNLPQVAEEMGTSVAMLHRHYHAPRAREEGEEWFALRPEMVLIGSDFGDVPVRTGGGEAAGNLGKSPASSLGVA